MVSSIQQSWPSSSYYFDIYSPYQDLVELQKYISDRIASQQFQFLCKLHCFLSFFLLQRGSRRRVPLHAMPLIDRGGQLMAQRVMERNKCLNNSPGNYATSLATYTTHTLASRPRYTYIVRNRGKAIIRAINISVMLYKVHYMLNNSILML